MNIHVAKRVRDSDVKRILARIARLERRIQAAFRAYLATARDQMTTRRLARMLAQGRVEEALAEIDRIVIRFGTVIPAVYTAAGQAEVADLVMQMADGRAGAIGISFNPGSARAAAMMEAQRLDLIREVSRTQRTAIRLTLAEGLQEGAGPIGQARRFQSAIGLTERQLEAVGNYRRLLEEGSAEALSRDIRDRRFDPSVARAARTGEPLSRDQIDRMVDRYRERFRQYRGEVIARTEAGRAVAEAGDEAMRQVREGLDLDEGVITRVWRATRDGRTRDTHAAMDGQTTSLDGVFRSPSGAVLRYPHDPRAPASETVQCRCVVVNRVREGR